MLINDIKVATLYDSCGEKKGCLVTHNPTGMMAFGLCYSSAMNELQKRVDQSNKPQPEPENTEYFVGKRGRNGIHVYCHGDPTYGVFRDLDTAEEVAKQQQMNVYEFRCVSWSKTVTVMERK